MRSNVWQGGRCRPSLEGYAFSRRAELERVVLAAVGGHGVLDGPAIGLTPHGVEQEQRVPHLDVKQRRRGGVRFDDVQATVRLRHGMALVGHGTVHALRREVIALEVGVGLDGNVALNEHVGLLVHVAKAHELVDLRTGLELKVRGDLLAGLLALEDDDRAANDAALAAHVLLEAANAHREALGDLGLGDDGAAALALLDVAVVREDLQRLANRGAADAIVLRKLDLGRDDVALLVGAILDLCEKVVLDQRVERCHDSSDSTYPHRRAHC